MTELIFLLEKIKVDKGFLSPVDFTGLINLCLIGIFFSVWIC